MGSFYGRGDTEITCRRSRKGHAGTARSAIVHYVSLPTRCSTLKILPTYLYRVRESSIDTDSETTKTHSLLLKYRSETQRQLETVEQTTEGLQDSVKELSKVQKSSSAVSENKLDQVAGKLSSLQKANVAACEQWCSVKGSVEATKQAVDEGNEIRKATSEALEKKIDAATEKVTSRLSLLERCQTHYFPTLISYARSIKNISQTNSNRLQEVQDCQRTYFPRLLFAIQATLVKFDDLLDLGAQLVRL